MNKGDFINKLSEQSNLPKSYCSRVLNACYSVLIDSLKKGEELNLKGFGRFFVKTRRERLVKNPLTGNKILIEQKNIPRFKLSTKFKDVIR